MSLEQHTRLLKADFAATLPARRPPRACTTLLYAQVCNPDELLHYLSNYLTELSLLDHIMMSFLPSEIAAAAVYLSNLMLRRPGWDGTLQHYSTYAPRDLLACTRALAQLHQAIAGNSQLAAIREKYMTPRFQAVSRVPLTPALMQQLGA